ncbi:uncharacterized protein [Chironomus tepperi]|uniref:uncharacterized protein n=1 Tax=Chironomus tepperi TaxID=113505 RepID=UPI00391F2493
MVVQAKSSSSSENVEVAETQESSNAKSESATKVLNLMKKRHKSSLKNGFDSLEVLRMSIQSYFNKQVDVIMKDFVDKFFQPAIENIKENTDEKIEEQQIKKICRNLLEDCARTQYSYDTTPSILKSSIKSDSDTNDETDSGTSLLHQALKRKRTESEAENLYKRQFFITTATNNFINAPVPSTVTTTQKPTASLLTSALTSPPKAMRHTSNPTRPIFHLIPANRNLKSTHVELLNLLKQNSSLPAIKTEPSKTIVTTTTVTTTSDSNNSQT